MKYTLILVFIALFAFPLIVNAQEADSLKSDMSTPDFQWNKDAAPEQVSFFDLVAKATGVLFIIGLMIYGLVWFMRWFMRKNALNGVAPDSIRLLTTVSIAPRKQVGLLKVFDKAILLSITDDGIETLMQLDDESGWKDLMNSESSKTLSKPSFSEKLTSAIAQSFKGDKNEN